MAITETESKEWKLPQKDVRTNSSYHLHTWIGREGRSRVLLANACGEKMGKLREEETWNQLKKKKVKSVK